MYVYNADTYCDSCGDRIREELTAAGLAPKDAGDEYSYDSDDFPKYAAEEATDGPDHCASENCLAAVDLREYGLASDAVMVGAETPTIGALLSDGLMDTSYLREMLDEPARTPYQEALHRYWREIFADELA